MNSQRKRAYDDDNFFTLSYKSDPFSDQLTPPRNKRQFNDSFSTFSAHESIQQSVSQSLTSPPPSPFASQLNGERPLLSDISTEELDDPDEYRLLDKPPHGISPDEYHKAIPLNVPQHVRMTQLLIWSAQEAMKQNTVRAQTLEDRRADQIAASIQARLIQGLREGNIVTSWYTRLPGPSTETAVKKTPNPRNEVNRRRIQDFKQVLKSLYEEEHEWRDVTSQLFADHAAMLDSSSKENIPTPITLDLLDSLDDNQKQFVETYCQDDNETPIPERIDFEEMEAEVTDLRQKLSVVHHFQRGAERYCKDTMGTIARGMERETCIPTDRTGLAYTVDQDQAIRESKKETAKSVLQALSNLNKP